MVSSLRDFFISSVLFPIWFSVRDSSMGLTLCPRILGDFCWLRIHRVLGLALWLCWNTLSASSSLCRSVFCLINRREWVSQHQKAAKTAVFIMLTSFSSQQRDYSASRAELGHYCPFCSSPFLFYPAINNSEREFILRLNYCPCLTWLT